VRRAIVLGLVVSVVTGCAGGVPQPDLVKFAARDWAKAHLHPRSLRVTSVSVAPDERRAKVQLEVDGRSRTVRLERPEDAWRVVAAG
jgi:hypothetical protein